MTLRITHVSSSDITGGAARCAYRLHRGLRALGHDSRMLVKRRWSSDASVDIFERGQGWRHKAERRFRRWRIRRANARYRKTRPAWPERFSDDRSWYWAGPVRELETSDIINLHWVAGFVDYRNFFDNAAECVPLVWTLHDMNAFTGGCHYDDGCGRYREYCGACPQLGSEDDRDLSREVWGRKRECFEGLAPERLHFVTPSRWLAESIRSSSLLGERFEISVIPYGVDTDCFAPRDKTTARASLGIPAHAKVVLFVAQAVEVRRKGFSLLMDALSDLELADLFLVSLGGGKLTVPTSVPHVHLGHTSEDRQLSLIYSAADLLVIPSLEDNLPATMIEALACGTPVVGFAVGGIPDAVRPGVTGALAAPEDVRALREAVRQLLVEPARLQELAASCRRIAVEEYGLELQARRYEALYERLRSAVVQGKRNSTRQARQFETAPSGVA